MKNKTERSAKLKFGVFSFSIAILLLGYISFGFWTMMIFTSGFLGGFLLWLLFPTQASYGQIKDPYWLSLGLFVLHRIEEKLSGFFQVLSEITGSHTPRVDSWNVILLVLLSVGAWLSIPLLIKRKSEVGYYLAWTFFAAMGITELAHWLVLPFFLENSYRYFPGMISVVPLAPVGWWGMWRLYKGR
jgi:hypothetical protein